MENVLKVSNRKRERERGRTRDKGKKRKKWEASEPRRKKLKIYKGNEHCSDCIAYDVSASGYRTHCTREHDRLCHATWESWKRKRE